MEAMLDQVHMHLNAKILQGYISCMDINKRFFGVETGSLDYKKERYGAYNNVCIVL